MSKDAGEEMSSGGLPWFAIATGVRCIDLDIPTQAHTNGVRDNGFVSRIETPFAVQCIAWNPVESSHTLRDPRLIAVLWTCIV